MSALGQKQTSSHVHIMSVIPLKADINQRGGRKEKAAVLPAVRSPVLDPSESASLSVHFFHFPKNENLRLLFSSGVPAILCASRARFLPRLLPGISILPSQYESQSAA